jgi:hypothetical protein
MPFSSTTPQDVTYIPQYIEETVVGSMPGSGNFTAIAPTALFSLISDKGAVPIFGLGSRDPISILDGFHVSGFTLRFNPINTDFLKYAFNLASGTGTIAKTLSFAAKVQVGGLGQGAGTSYYFTANHARIATATITATTRSPLLAECYMICKNPTFSTSPPAPTMTQTLPTGNALMFQSGGSTAVTWGATTINTGTIHARIDNELSVIPIIGSQEYQEVLPGARDFRLVFSAVFSDPTSLMADYLAYTQRNLVWTLNSTGPKTLTTTNGQLVSLTDLGFDIADLTVSGRFGLRGSKPTEETYAIFGTSLALT